MVEVREHTRNVNGKKITIKKHSRKDSEHCGCSASEFLDRRKQKNVVLKDGKKRFLVSPEGEKLAKITIDAETDESLNLSGWRALKKGKGYGRELLKSITDKKPDLWLINTDGFTEMGARNMEKSLSPEFKLVDWRFSGSSGVGRLVRQDAIDYYIDRAREGKVMLFAFPDDMHSDRLHEHSKT